MPKKAKKPIVLKTDSVTLLKLVEDLRGYDHAFLNENGVRRFTEPFGFTGSFGTVKANPRDPKGLTLHGGATEAVGQDACVVAQQICHHLNVEYEGKFGRGSQLRACCDALEAYLKGLS